MRLARTLDFVSATQNQSLMDALAVVLANEGRKAEWVSNSVDLRVCSERWRTLIVRPDDEGPPVNRRYLEMGVFSHFVSERKSGDTFVVGSERTEERRVGEKRVRTGRYRWAPC